MKPAVTRSALGNQYPDKKKIARLRRRYRHAGDTLNEQELARLAFVRWLYRRGQLES